VGSRPQLDGAAAGGTSEVWESGLHVEGKLLAVLGRFKPSNALVHWTASRDA
jgi:hypothetical protein